MAGDAANAIAVAINDTANRATVAANRAADTSNHAANASDNTGDGRAAAGATAPADPLLPPLPLALLPLPPLPLPLLTLPEPALLDPESVEAQTVALSRFAALRMPATVPALRARPCVTRWTFSRTSPSEDEIRVTPCLGPPAGLALLQ